MGRVVTPHLGIAPVFGLLAVFLVIGCASNLVRTETGFHNPRHGYSVGVPGGPGAEWERIEIEGTLGLILNDPTLYEELKLLVGGANRSGVIRTMIRLMSNDDD